MHIAFDIRRGGDRESYLTCMLGQCPNRWPQQDLAVHLGNSEICSRSRATGCLICAVYYCVIAKLDKLSFKTLVPGKVLCRTHYLRSFGARGCAHVQTFMMRRDIKC